MNLEQKISVIRERYQKTAGMISHEAMDVINDLEERILHLKKCAITEEELLLTDLSRAITDEASARSRDMVGE